MRKKVKKARKGSHKLVKKKKVRKKIKKKLMKYQDMSFYIKITQGK